MPFPSVLRSRISAIFSLPALFGTRHRTPVSNGIGIMPTRGQALFIGYLVLLNMLVFSVDYHPGPQPNAWFADSWEQVMCYAADRAGSLCFANISLMLLYSARNNLLLHITDWSHSTFLLLHRWVGYIAIFQGATHCLIWVHWYVKMGTHNEEAKELYWIWGIVAIVSMCLMYPLSLLPVRRRLYEFFLLSHITLAVLFLVGCYMHVWLLYENNWGYEIWIYTAGAVWGADRVFRIWRFVRNGLRRAELTKIDDDYVRIDIDGVVAHGHAYLYFPTVKLTFWENHPFSIASSFSGRPGPPPRIVQARGLVDEETKAVASTDATHVDSAESTNSEVSVATNGIPRPRLTFVARIQNGMTKSLALRAGSSIPVLVESSYHNPGKNAELAQCTTLLCIAGGVGICTVLPLLRSHPGPRARLYWGMRRSTLKDALTSETAGLDIVYSVGQRLDLAAILNDELLRKDEKGLLGIVVSGPEGMADDVRDILCQMSASGRAVRGVVFIDEAFSW
jgi:predicted ferric reductase